MISTRTAGPAGPAPAEGRRRPASGTAAPAFAGPKLGHRLSAASVATLQAAAGNRAVMTLLTRAVQRASAAMGEGAQPWIRPGDVGPNVTDLQNRLNTVGSGGTPLTVTGRYDAATLKAVKAFQRESGLDTDGIVGPLTYEALDRRTTTTAETVTTGPDVTGNADAPTPAEIAAINAELNPTSTGPAGAVNDWDGRADPVKAAELDTETSAAMQANLDGVTPRMRQMEAAKAAGTVVTTTEQEGAGRQAKKVVDALFGDIATAATLTTAQAAGRASFAFKAGVNLLDASDPSVRTPDPDDLTDWLFETDEDSSKAQKKHGFNEHRTTQGEPAFAQGIKTRFIAKGSNRADLERFDQFGFFFAEEGPRVLSQTALVGSAGFSTTVAAGRGISDAERLDRWSTWETLVHEYIHTLEHPNFGKASKGGNRIMKEGFCELFTKDVLLHHGGIANAESDADPSLRIDIEGGDESGFDPKFVPDYDPGEYAGFLDHAEKIRAQVGEDATRAAFFLGHVEHIGLKPNGEMIDPAAPDAKKFLAPERVKIPSTVRSVTAVSILTGAPEADILAANSGLPASGPLPASAHSTGLIVPGTTQHRTLEVTDRAGGRATETKADIGRQHGVAEHAIQRANPNLNHREPKSGEWVLIPVHT
jgi:peptidoglycan hydrolase-like protein with peptidoglycan-binding domain